MLARRPIRGPSHSSACTSTPHHLSAPHPVVTTLLLLLKHTLVVNIQPAGDKVVALPPSYLSANKPARKCLCQNIFAPQVFVYRTWCVLVRGNVTLMTGLGYLNSNPVPNKQHV
ncbi:hypothetical protein NPIL_178741 [Nephila pilipes]|uniref:Uncharacterized protein n=1 Tax=Nephila pilipes TaxID=299642 RepID=A0A8X6TCS9_NEPPI|nr:hypothetical protein NPIL_178741 [Nephila pilipes]